MFDRSVPELVRLGMTEYEARVYSSLVGLGEGTARQVHEACGVPRPRVYDILESLESKGYVEVWQGKPKYYRAVPPDRLMRLLREDLEDSMRTASSELQELSLKAKQRSFPVWHIKGEMSIQDQVRTFLSEVKKDLMVVCTRTSTFRPLVKELKEIATRADVFCMVPEDAETFRAALGDATVVEPHLGNDSLAETYVKVFTGKLESSEDLYRAEMLIIVDARRSLLIYEMNGERTALVFELPLIVALQHSAIMHMVEEGQSLTQHNG
ncbi:MAG: Sugar-specific transcriptional regulator TrmB [Methanomassiliicoccales archaeon PtaU1.Bin124]|nr:MAG: Sugar-specific transcriptional regulator TrmB [Methanomassiliicoccales archaeon PtaU1.Bin124]